MGGGVFIFPSSRDSNAPAWRMRSALRLCSSLEYPIWFCPVPGRGDSNGRSGEIRHVAEPWQRAVLVNECGGWQGCVVSATCQSAVWYGVGFEFLCCFTRVELEKVNSVVRSPDQRPRF